MHFVNQTMVNTTHRACFISSDQISKDYLFIYLVAYLHSHFCLGACQIIGQKAIFTQKAQRNMMLLCGSYLIVLHSLFPFNWHLENQPHKLLCTFLHDTISSCSPYLYLRGCTAFSFFFLVGLCSFLMFVTGHDRGSFYHRGVWRPP